MPSHKQQGLILLDRDGVLNSMVIHPDHGTVDSPLHPSQVNVFPWVPKALRVLQEQGYGLAIVTNQPAAAKGKTTRTNLELVHHRVLELIQSEGARILSSHICFHRQEDQCECRKPKPGLLQNALNQNSNYERSASWMVGDGVHDVKAGNSLGLFTAFVGSKRWDTRRVFEDAQILPNLTVENLLEFSEILPKFSG